MKDKLKIEFQVSPEYFPAISSLPWNLPIVEWGNSDVKKIRVKHGICRHPIIFVESKGYRFAVKETSAEYAKKEILNYEKLLQRGIPTLDPVGFVIREEEPIIEETVYGKQLIENKIGYVVTILAEKVLPESRLYKRGFKLENRKKIWDAIVNLMVKLHTNNILWGDASLQNVLIHFKKEIVPNFGKKTVLEAILADAETVEVHNNFSYSLSNIDINQLFESMDWLAEDLKKAGIQRDPKVIASGKQYIWENYTKLMKIQNKEREFEEITNLDVKNAMGEFSEVEYADILLKHIEKHKWYLNEGREEEITFEEAAKDWYENIFVPICDIFRREKLPELFPGKTATDLYVEIMQHKYFMSEKAKRDVGFTTAMKDYCKKFGESPSSPSLLRVITNSILKILGKREEKLIEVDSRYSEIF